MGRPEGDFPVLRGYNPVEKTVVFVYSKINSVGTIVILHYPELLQVQELFRISSGHQMCGMNYTHFRSSGAPRKDDNGLRRGWNPTTRLTIIGCIAQIQAIRYGLNQVIGHDKEFVRIIEGCSWGYDWRVHSAFILRDWSASELAEKPSMHHIKGMV